MFVIVASLLAVATVIWLGASRYFEVTDRFVTYFGESVQGLEPGSAVKYRGVPAGRVAAIRIAPDGELIEVVLDIDVKSSEALHREITLRATLELSGITGLRYVEIDRRVGEALLQAPQLSFQPPYDVIPSARSSFKAVQSALADVYDKFMQVDFAGISNDTRATLQAANMILRDPRIDGLLTNVNEISESASQLAKDFQRITGDIDLAPMIANLNAASGEARALLADLHSGQGGKELRLAIEQLNRLTQSAQQVVVASQIALERIDRTASSFQSLADEVRAQPSSLLFAPPPGTRPVGVPE